MHGIRPDAPSRRRDNSIAATIRRTCTTVNDTPQGTKLHPLDIPPLEEGHSTALPCIYKLDVQSWNLRLQHSPSKNQKKNTEQNTKEEEEEEKARAYPCGMPRRWSRSWEPTRMRLRVMCCRSSAVTSARVL
eukprot:3439564-Rhodomonas_salina.1